MGNPTLAPEHTIRLYAALMEQAIVSLRQRIRCGETVALDEVHDILDALHNIPHMIYQYGNWHIEENIQKDLEAYDQKWPMSDTRLSLATMRERAKGTLESNGM